MRGKLDLLSEVEGSDVIITCNQVSNECNATPQRTPKMFPTQASKRQGIELFTSNTVAWIPAVYDPWRSNHDCVSLSVALVYLVMVAFAQPAAPAPRVSFLDGFNSSLCQHTTLQTQ
jgi:hypothetical protein